jgi:hypothetical protein
MYSSAIGDRRIFYDHGQRGCSQQDKARRRFEAQEAPNILAENAELIVADRH